MTKANTSGEIVQVSDRVRMRRSALRQIVRHTWQIAAPRLPPGMIKAQSSGSCSSSLSISRSMRSTSSEVRILAAFSCVFSWSVARCEPIENSLCCILRIKSRSASSSKYVFNHPRWELSSSIVPYASKRIWVFGTRLPPTRLVVPLSPVFVYTRLFS